MAIGDPVRATAPSYELQAPKRPIPTTTQLTPNLDLNSKIQQVSRNFKTR